VEACGSLKIALSSQQISIQPDWRLIERGKTLRPLGDQTVELRFAFCLQQIIARGVGVYRLRGQAEGSGIVDIGSSHGIAVIGKQKRKTFTTDLG
jgi:hypothetical protein